MLAAVSLSPRDSLNIPYNFRFIFYPNQLTDKNSVGIIWKLLLKALLAFSVKIL